MYGECNFVGSVAKTVEPRCHLFCTTTCRNRPSKIYCYAQTRGW